MARSVINLLPPELLNSQKKQRTLAVIIWAASGTLLLVIIIATSTLLYKLFQIQESLLYNIHTRLSAINQIQSQNSTAFTQYNLTMGLVPPGFRILSFGNDGTNQVKTSLESTGAARLKPLFDSLTNPQNAEGKVAKIIIDSLARNAQDKYKLDLTINYK